MQFFVLLSLLVEIFGTVLVSTKAAKPRSINVALDTVFEFDKSSDVDFINEVQGILTKVKNKIKDNPKQDNNEYTMRVKRYKFTNFLEDLIDTVLSFNDKDLMEIVQIVKNEIQETKHGDTLHENIRRFLSNELNLIKVKAIRKDLDKLLRKLQNPKKDDNILGFINTLYKRDTQVKLSNFIRKLKIFRQRSRKSGQLQHSVRKILQNSIDYFSNLPEDTKRKVEARLKEYLQDDFSTVHNDKTYLLKPKQNNKITIEPELVLQNSEDTNTEETIEIEENGFKSHRNYMPYVIQDRIEKSEILTKTLNKKEIVNVKQKILSNEEVISVEKVTENGSHVTSEARIYTNSKYSTDTTRLITYPKLKRSRNKKNKRKSKSTELSTKIYVPNNFLNVKPKNYNQGEAISIEKVTKKEINDEKSKKIYGHDDTPQATYSKPRRSRTKKNKKKSKNADIIYSKDKLTHITLYPGNIKIEKRNFRALIEDKNNKGKNRRTLDDVTLSSMSNSAEINVFLKNKKIRFVYDDNKDKVRKEALMKVRALRHKLMKSKTTGDTKYSSEHHSENLNIKRNEITTPKPSLAYFGNLFKSKGVVTVEESDLKHFDDSDIDHTYKVTEFFGKIDDRIIENINKATTIITRSKLDEKQRDFRATDVKNNFQDKADYRLSKQVAEDKSAKNLKTVDKTKKKYVLTTSGYRPIPRQDSNTVENKPVSKFKAIEITSESDDRLAEDIEENISNKNIKTNEITTKDYEDLEEYNFVENKQESNLTTIEITTGDFFLNNRGYRRTNEPKTIDKVSLNIIRNDINAKSKSNENMDIKKTLTSNFDYNMEYTTRQKIKNTHKTLLRNQPITKADKINNKLSERIVHKGTKKSNKIVENQPTHRKSIPKQLTKKLQELSTKFTEKVTKNEGMNEISNHINLGIDMQEKQYDTTKTQVEFKSNNKINNLRLEIKSNQTEVHDLRRKTNFYTNITPNINKDNKPMIGDTVKIINSQIVNIRRQTNVNPKKTTKSYNKDIKPINKTNNSRRQLNMNAIATTVVNKNNEIDANFKENNKISTIAVGTISLDIEVTKIKEIKLNNTKVNDLRMKLKTTPIVIFKDELLDTEFMEEIKNSEKNPVPIDIQKFIKNPEVADVGDEQKKMEIEQKMKEDLSNLFTSPVTNATTTAAYTDIFEAMDDEFGLGPLK